MAKKTAAGKESAFCESAKGLKLPDTVYRQAVWAARDLPRLRKKLSELEEERDTLYAADPSRERLSRNGSVFDMTGKKAAELAQLSQRVRAMEAAFEITPDKYQQGIRDYLCLGEAYPETFHRNTWKRWQKVVIYQLAVNLKIL